MKARIPMEVTVAVLGGVACLVTAPGLGLALWSVFIGWAWYFSLGATPAAFKQIYPSMIPGALLAALCLWMDGWLVSLGWGAMISLVVAVIITVYLLMLSLKIPLTSSSLPSFNSYSTVFALFFIGGYPSLAIGPILSCTLWALIGLALGPIFGYLSVVLTLSKEK